MTRAALAPPLLKSLFLLGLCCSALHSADETSVQLVEQGTEPHELLRYSVKEDAEWLLFIDRSLDTEVKWREKLMEIGAMPNFRFRLPVQVVKPKKPETIQLKLSGITLEFFATEQSTPATNKALTEFWKPLAEVEIALILDTRGVLLSTEVQGPEKITPFFEADLEALVQAVEALVVPLPSEAVGVSGIWTVERPTNHLHFLGTQTQRISFDSGASGDHVLIIKTQRNFTRQSKKPRSTPDLETLHYLEGAWETTAHLDLQCPLAIHATVEGSSRKKVENLLTMLVETDATWKIEAGIVPPKGGDEAWARKSQLFGAPESEPKKE